MPELDLEPHEYSRPDPRTGKMVRDFSPKWARNWFLFCVALLIWVFWNKDGFHSVGLVFGLAAFWAFLGGAFFHHWLKDRY